MAYAPLGAMGISKEVPPSPIPQQKNNNKKHTYKNGKEKKKLYHGLQIDSSTSCKYLQQ